MSEHYELPEVLVEELRIIEEERGERKAEGYYSLGGGHKGSRFLKVVPKLHQAKLAALCLSGGGIRSATFNLGVLQGLAKLGILKEIDFLSTVSGGGYIGGWFSSWISREKGSAGEQLARVVETLAQETPQTGCKEPCQVKFLRDYSNYLTPRVGIFSIDTWAIIGTYLRNLLLNWLVLVPLFFAFFLIPRFIVCLTCIAAFGVHPVVLLGTAAFLGTLPIAYAVVDLPSIGNQKNTKGAFITFFLVPLVLMACSLSAYWACVYRPGCEGVPGLGSFVNFALAVHVAGWILGIGWLLIKRVPVHHFAVLKYAGCAAATGGLAGVLGWAAGTKLVPALLQGGSYPKLLYATFSVPAVLMVYLLTGAVLVALLSRTTGDDDREWWGRAAGVVILAGAAWGVTMAAVLYGPWMLLPDSRDFWKLVYTAVGAASGVAAAAFGKDSSTPALRPGIPMSTIRTSLLAMSAALFLLFCVQVLSLLATWVLWSAEYLSGAVSACLPPPVSCAQFPALSPPAVGFTFHTHLHLLCSTPLGMLAALGGVSAALSLLMAWMVNVNKFSMHSMYRNRLVRCYLGASREPEERKPNRFTGFDEADNLPLKNLPKRPLHVVNVAWNLVKGRRLAWQQRKAASFIMSPLFAGSDIDAPRTAGWEPGGFRRIDEYGAGRVAATRHPLTLGTAMAISGAAASPNMGYHSSPLVTFVMALFNVRLGWWLGNPGKGMGDAWRMASPGLSVRPLLKETFGRTNEESHDIYLSDGGHFENLALYEMVRRRCRYLIVCDAGCDCDSSFSDLGNAVRKVRADFGIEIEIDLEGIRGRKSHFAVGRVRYTACEKEGTDGLLLYIKPVLTGDEPVDEYNYEKMHPEFPHEPTADQWFDEAQFESYRKLGFHAVEGVMDAWSPVPLEEFFSHAQLRHDATIKELAEKKKPGAKRASTGRAGGGLVGLLRRLLDALQQGEPPRPH